MATFTWLFYSDTPAWHDISTNTVVFSGSGGIDTPITVGNWNAETHIGTGDPGTDQCGTNHGNNAEYISSTQVDIGGGTVAINDTNVTDNDATIAVQFTDGSAVATSNARFYTFDGTTETTEAVGIEAYAFETGVGASTWTQINDDSGNIGGDNSGERLSLSDQSSGTEHTFYICVSARPESVGSKTEFDFGVALTYS